MPLTTTDKIDAIISTYHYSLLVGWLSQREPLFRHHDRIPRHLRDAFKEVRSSDLANIRVDSFGPNLYNS